MTRDARETWQRAGSKDLATVIQEKLKEILETHEVPQINGNTLSAIRQIREKGEKLLAKS